MPIVKDRRLSELAYYKTGGTADVIYSPTSVAELAANVREAQARAMPLMLLGGGTNSLVMDEHFPGAVVLFSGLSRLEVRGSTVTVGAGVENSHFARTMLAQKLEGAAWMNGLPGQIGGTVRMNARCYGGEISQIVTKVTTVTRTGEIKTYAEKSMFKGYKDTVFMSNEELIAEADVQLAPGDPGAIEAKMRSCIDDRKSKGQYDFPSCGCVFKNDYTVGVSSGILLDQVGAKEMKHEGAEVSPFHANFVFNKGATSRAILELTLEMRARVYAKFGAWLDYEMELLGSVPPDLLKSVREKRPHRLDAAQLAPLRARMKSDR